MTAAHVCTYKPSPPPLVRKPTAHENERRGTGEQLRSFHNAQSRKKPGKQRGDMKGKTWEKSLL